MHINFKILTLFAVLSSLVVFMGLMLIQQQLVAEEQQVAAEEAILEAQNHLGYLKSPGAAYVFDSEEERLREVLTSAELELADIGLTDADIENLRIESYRTTAVAHLKSIQAQPLYAATYVADNTKYYLDYIGQSSAEYGVSEEQFRELETCGFAILASRVESFKSSGRHHPIYDELGSYLEHRDLTKLSREASIKLMDHVAYGLETDPSCAPYL